MRPLLNLSAADRDVRGGNVRESAPSDKKLVSVGSRQFASGDRPVLGTKALNDDLLFLKSGGDLSGAHAKWGLHFNLLELAPGFQVRPEPDSSRGIL